MACGLGLVFLFVNAHQCVDPPSLSSVVRRFHQSHLCRQHVIVGGCKLATSFTLPLNGPSMKSMAVCLRVGSYGLVNTGFYQPGDMMKNHRLSSLLQSRFGLASAQSHLAIAMASHSLALWVGLASQTLWD